MLYRSHFAMSDHHFEAHFGGGVLTFLNDMLTRAQAMGPGGVVLAKRVLEDVQASNWLALAGDVATLVQLVVNSAAPAAA